MYIILAFDILSNKFETCMDNYLHRNECVVVFKPSKPLTLLPLTAETVSTSLALSSRACAKQASTFLMSLWEINKIQ